MEALLQQIEEWNEAGEYRQAIAAIEAVPEGERGYRLTLWLGRLYSNLAVLGEHDRRCYTDSRGLQRKQEPDNEKLRKGIDLLLSIREEGEGDATWNSRMAFSLWALSEPRKAEAHARRWLELAPEDPDAAQLLEELTEYRRHTEKGKKKY